MNFFIMVLVIVGHLPGVGVLFFVGDLLLLVVFLNMVQPLCDLRGLLRWGVVLLREVIILRYAPEVLR